MSTGEADTGRRFRITPEGVAIGERVVELRRQHGWSQRQLAQFAGVSASFVSYLEAGKMSSPGVRHFMAVANTLGVRMETLLDLAGYSTKVTSNERSKSGRARLAGHVLSALRRSKAPIVYIHSSADASPEAVLMSMETLDRLAGLIPEGKDDGLFMDHDHLAPE